MTLEQAKATFGLTAKATPTGENVTNKVTIGQDVTVQSYSDANVAYHLKLNSTGATDDATLTYSSGAVVRNVGTPDVTRWGSQTGDTAGEDFEGVTLPTLATLYALLIKAPSTNTGTVDVTHSAADLPDYRIPAAAQTVLIEFPAGLATPGTANFVWDTSGDELEITVIGKTA